MEKVVELTPLAEMGKGRVRVTDNSVEIDITGINGGMKAWLIGGEAVAIGNIVDGKLKKQINTQMHSGVLITQSGRQMLLGMYRDELAEKTQEETVNEEKVIELAEKTTDIPFNVLGFDWERVTCRRFENIARELRYILSNKSVYENYKKYGHYWIGESADCGALALKYEESDPDPLNFLGKLKFTENGYVIVCVDKKTKKLYIPKER